MEVPSWISTSTEFASVKGDKPNISTVSFMVISVLFVLRWVSFLLLPGRQHGLRPVPTSGQVSTRQKLVILSRWSGRLVRPKIPGDVIEAQGQEFSLARLGGDAVPIQSSQVPVYYGIGLEGHTGQRPGS